MRVSERRNRRRKELGHSVHLFYDCSRALGDAGNASLAVDPNNTRPASPTSPRPRSDVRRLAPFGGARLATGERGGGELDHANVMHATCLFTMAGRVSGCNLAFVKWHLGRCGGRMCLLIPPAPSGRMISSASLGSRSGATIHTFGAAPHLHRRSRPRPSSRQARATRPPV